MFDTLGEFIAVQWRLVQAMGVVLALTVIATTIVVMCRRMTR